MSGAVPMRPPPAIAALGIVTALACGEPRPGPPAAAPRDTEARPAAAPESAHSPPESQSPRAAAAPTAAAPDRRSRAGRTAVAPTRLLFRHTGLDRDYGRLAEADLADLGSRRFVGSLSCRVIGFAGGSGLCLQSDPVAFASYRAQLLDAQLRPGAVLPLGGIPSRTRVAPDGKLAAATVFVSGHSYATSGFSTLTQLIEVGRGAVLADLEEFSVTRAGAAFRADDFNFWGVTFTPDSRGFYCTLSSGGRHYLVKGDPAARTATVVHEDVECPSLSPDGSRIAFKRRLAASGPVKWRLHVLDLASSREHALAEERSVDDQLEWLDDARVLYAVADGASAASTSVWVADADGVRAPTRLLPNAYSPVVVP